MRRAETLTFGGGALDRAAHLRNETTRFLTTESTRVALIWRGKPLLDISTYELALLNTDHPLIADQTHELLFLGQDDQHVFLAHDISHWDDPNDTQGSHNNLFDEHHNHHPELPDTHRFCDLRSAMSLLSTRDGELSATMRGMFEWARSHQFCPSCGGKNMFDQGGWRAICTSCERQQFPRTDPVVIMLITNGNSALLGRASNWPEGMYSCLAGFMEPGETIQAAVRRETKEESGITVGPVRILASQPWVFPASLMIGCHGVASDTELNIDPNELEDAQWVSREKMIASYAGLDSTIKPSRSGAIATFLIQNWLKDTLD